MRQNLGEMLLAANLIDEVQMKVALAEQQRTGRRFGSTLVDLKFIDENVLAAFLSKQIDTPCISLLHVEVPKKLLRRLPLALIRQTHAVPIREHEGTLEVAMIDPSDSETVRAFEEATGMKVVPLVAPQSSIEKMIERLAMHDDETLRARAPVTTVSDPIFADIIDEIESGDIGERLRRIEESLGQLWTLLEKVLRELESRHTVPTEFRSSHNRE